MTNKPWVNWLLTFAALLIVGVGGGFLLGATGMETAGRWTSGVFGLLAHAWLYYGIWKWRDRRWVQGAGIIFITGDIAGVLSLFALLAGSVPLALAISGMWSLTVFFVLGLAVIRFALLGGFPMFGVARTLIDEAIRMKVALIFIVVLLIMLPLLPLLVSQNDRLEYRITNMITFSMIITSFVLSALTIGVCVLSLNQELRNRQIFLTMTKPIGRWQYLMGKWLGMTLLNLLLVAVCGLGTYLFVQVMRSTGDYMDEEDQRIVNTEILTARRIMVPLPDQKLFDDAVNEQLEAIQAKTPGGYSAEMRDRDEQTLRKEMIQSYFTIERGSGRYYTFKGLGYLRDDPDAHVSLRMRPRMVPPPPAEKIIFMLLVNGRQYRFPAHIANDTFYTARIDASLIDENGELEIRVFNNVESEGMRIPRNAQLMFKMPEGFELLHRVDSFEMNLARSMTVIWIRLWFIAALALAAGTFLSLPIACILAGMMYLAAASSGFVSEGLDYYAGFGYSMHATTWEKIIWVLNFIWEKASTGDIYGLFKIMLQLIGSTFMLFVPQLSSFNPTPLISDGRYVPWSMVFDALIWVGVIWTGVTGVCGWLIFRKRELARVVV